MKKPTHYAHRSMTGAIFIKEAEFFVEQGGLEQSWGSRWHPVIARDTEHARIIAERVGGSKRFPDGSRTKLPFEEIDYSELEARVTSFMDTTDAMEWAKAFIKTIRDPNFEVPNIWDEGFMVGWFANAIETGRAAGFNEGRQDMAKQLLDKPGPAKVDPLHGHPEVAVKLQEALDRYDKLTPEEKEKHDEAQRHSFGTRVGVRGTMTGRLKKGYSPSITVPPGQTPLNDDLHHPLLDVINEGSKARDEGVTPTYHPHSLEYCLHAMGWVQRDLVLERDRVKPAIKALKEWFLEVFPQAKFGKYETERLFQECQKLFRP